MKNQYKSDNERLAVVETKIDDLKSDVKKIYDSIEHLGETMGKKMSDHEIFERRLDRLEAQSNLWKWLSPSLAAIAGSILTFLIIEYLGSL